MNVITKKESVVNRTQLAMDKLQRLACRWLTSDELELVQKGNKQTGLNQDSAILYILHKHFGFTAEQLKEFYNKYTTDYAYMEYNFEYAINDIPEVQLLKDINVDLHEMYKG